MDWLFEGFLLVFLCECGLADESPVVVSWVCFDHAAVADVFFGALWFWVSVNAEC